MPSYQEWNDALIEHFTYGAPVGSTIYLNVSDLALERIGQQRWGEPNNSTWAEDYAEAIREELVDEGCVFLGSVWDNDLRGRPLGVAFLGALVLVATRMDNDELQRISQNDYMTRLNQLLNTVPANAQIRRPKHMTTGKDGEEPLWKAWSRFLRSRGYQPTAAGGAGAWRYIGYAVSQTLLRAHERRKLGQIFATQHWGEQPEGEFIARQLRYLEGVPSHVQTLLRRDGQAAEDVYHALEEAYQEWQMGAEASGRVTLSARHLSAGLYRSEHFRTGEPIYSIFPKQARGLRLVEIAAEWEDGSETLSLERPGYYAPLGELTAEQLSTGLEIPLSGHPQLEHLHLPGRPFWILRPDPNSQGDFASLGHPEVGEQFLLLAHRKLAPELTSLREQGLIQWSKEDQWEDDWIEYHGMMVTANHWEEVAEVSRELLDALRPESGLGLSVTGGLRVPQKGAWLHCGPPTVSVATFFTEAFLTLRCGEEVLFAGSVEPNQPVELPWRGAGDYELEAEARGQGQVRLVKLLDFDELPQAPQSTLGSLTKTWQHADQTFALVGPELQTGGRQ